MSRRTNLPTMKRIPAASCLFLDIGGVLLSDGWDHHGSQPGKFSEMLGLPDLPAEDALRNFPDLLDLLA